MTAPPRSRPRVIAHRGSSEALAEHTMSAYEQAIADGADGLECDVRLTADGHLVCVHDRKVQRTSNGRGIVSTLELAELENLEWGSWKQPWADLDDEGPDRAEFGVLTLDRLLTRVRRVARPLELAIETKHPTRYAGLVERRLVEVLDRHGLVDPSAAEQRLAVRVLSFSRVSLRRLRRLAPALPTVLLADGFTRRIRGPLLPSGVTAYGPSIELVRRRPTLVAAAHARGAEVHVWTVNELADVDRCVELGVDVVITDRPAAVRARLIERMD